MSRKERRQGSKKATLESIKAWHKKRKVKQFVDKYGDTIGMTISVVLFWVLIWLLFAIDMCNNY